MNSTYYLVLKNKERELCIDGVHTLNIRELNKAKSKVLAETRFQGTNPDFWYFEHIVKL